VRAYPAAQLYTGQEEIQALMKGEIQMSYFIASPPVTPSEQAAWKKALQVVHQEFGAEIGPELIKETQFEVERLTATRK
jgi:TRAP-type C4-dicarboxylate transport system substrate-binding protein